MNSGALRIGAAVAIVLVLVIGVFAAVRGMAVRSAAPVVTPAPAPPVAWAPVDRPGPALTVPAAELEASVACTRATRASRDTALLLSGTGADPATSFDWGVRPLLTAEGFRSCYSTAPDRNTGDVAVRAEYVAHAIRTIAADTERKVAVVAFGEGGIAARWALRFWPDLRDQVSDVVLLGTPNGGLPLCSAGCSAADWQLATGSPFFQALDSGAATFPGIDYSVITSDLDTRVPPAAAALPGVASTTVQQVCPGREVEHLSLGLSDAVSLALAVDALRNPGPVDPTRIPPATCRDARPVEIQPGPQERGTAAVLAAQNVTGAPVNGEPPLPCYTRADPC
ncbi:esterase/lipase family protein [Pseudonocardia oroxyli]|uniref:Lipase n=1 Tax=Pseudonocardia oroxyli TaxID=366584 RepID=A0A1G8A370_PSEOR|nr:hypothetical protein [Pseudonocardia oroxyli]SDH14860.1 hypothetical protein SAMN05216377_119116 [Pseudonocardia oroxyli]